MIILKSTAGSQLDLRDFFTDVSKDETAETAETTDIYISLFGHAFCDEIDRLLIFTRRNANKTAEPLR